MGFELTGAFYKYENKTNIADTTMKYPTSIDASVMYLFHSAIWNFSIDLVQPAKAMQTITESHTEIGVRIKYISPIRAVPMS